MNEWYQLVHKYKSEQRLTWPQLAQQLGVNERSLRQKEQQPSARVLAKLRELFKDQSVDTGLGMQPTIFGSEHEGKAVSSPPNSKKTKAREVKSEMAEESEKSRRMNEKSEDAAALSDEEADGLLIQHEYVRDPIHQDIWITALERELIDSAAFQRLRNLKQLGPTHLVYPGAVHSRFLHSIGTLCCAQQLVDVVNRNHDIYKKPHLIRVGKYQQLLVRTCALLHDLAHMPFGHTLENEGNLNEPEWKDVKRVRLWLGNEDESPVSIAKTVRDYLRKTGIPEDKAARFVEDLRRYLVPPRKEDQPDYPMNLAYPYVVDIVGNTLCADLLDYLDRDMYFCGLRERSGDRVVKYLAIVRVKLRKDAKSDSAGRHERLEETDGGLSGRGRVVLLAYRVERAHVPAGGEKIVPKSEINSEAIDLLRRRYALAEKVYFHRTKVAASAMLISATANASLNWDDIYGISDEAFLSKLESSANKRTKRLIAKYKARQLYKVAYEIRYRPRRDEDKDSLTLYDELYTDFRNHNWRTAKEKEIERIAGLPDGSVVIYCPELGMNLKQFEMLVQSQPNSEIKPLKDILDPTREKEMQAINERFEQLWRLEILVDPEVLDVSVPSDRLYDLNKICEETMGFSNERADLDLKGKGRSIDDQVALRVIGEYDQEHSDKRLTTDMFEKLVTASRRAEGSDKIEQCRKHLEALTKSPE